MEKNPTAPAIDIVEKCFGLQTKGRVICFGEGVTPRDFRGPLPSKAELRAELQQKDQVIAELKDRLENVEGREEEHQKKIAEIEASHEKKYELLFGEIQKLKDKLSHIE